MLRLKGEPDDSMADHTKEEVPTAELNEAADDHPAFAPEQLVDVGGGDGEGEDFDEIEENGGRGLLSDTTRGLGIAAATFVPTFLIVVFGVPYLLAPASTARTRSEAPAVATAPPSWTPSFSLPEVLRGGSGDRPATPAPAASAPAPAPVPTPPAAVVPRVTEGPAQPAENPAPKERQQAQEPVASAPVPPTPPAAPPTANIESSPTPAAPALPPAPSRVPEPERKTAVLEPRSVPGSRQVSATPDPSRSRAESRRFSSDWTPAAAFADRDAAARLAGSIERQGYPVEIRQDTSSTRPWVVWIGTQPSGGSSRR